MKKHLRNTAGILAMVLALLFLPGPARAATAYGPANFCNLVVFVNFSGDAADCFNLPGNWDAIKALYDDNEHSDLAYTYQDTSFKNYIYTISEGAMVVDNYFPQQSADGTAVATITATGTMESYADAGGETRLLTQVIESLNASGYDTGRRLDYREAGVLDNLTVIVQATKGEDSGAYYYPHHTLYDGSATLWGKYVSHYNLIDASSLISLTGGYGGGSKQGVVAHEFLHTLGLPDLYRYTTPGTPVGIWDIMAGTSPYLQYPLSYSRSQLGWTTLPTLTAPGTYTLKAVSAQGGTKGYIITSPLREDEVFVVEYRRLNSTAPANVGYETKIPSSGMLVYRVNNSLSFRSNAEGNNYIYIFRDDPTTLGDATEPDITVGEGASARTLPAMYGAALDVEAGETAYGSLDLSAPYTDGTLYYADGTNSGLRLENLALSLDGENLTFDLVMADYTALHLWDKYTQESPGGAADIALAAGADGQTVYAALETQREEESDIVVRRSTGGEWATVGTTLAGRYEPSLYLQGSVLYLSCIDYYGRPYVYKLENGAWANTYAGRDEYVSSLQLFGDEGGVLCAYVAANTNLRVLNADTGNLVTADMTAGYVSRPALCKRGADIYVLYSDFFAGAQAGATVKKYADGAWTTLFTSELTATNAHAVVAGESEIWAIVGNAEEARLLYFDGTVWTEEEAPAFVNAGDVALLHDGALVYAAVVPNADKTGRVYRLTDAGPEPFGYSVSTNLNNMAVAFAGGRVFALCAGDGDVTAQRQTVLKYRDGEGVDLTVTLTIPQDYDTDTVYLDGRSFPGVRGGGTLAVSADGTGYKTAVMYKYGANGVPTGMAVWELHFLGRGYNAEPVPQLEDILSYHGFSIRITGSPGIRFKTGITPAARDALRGSGLAGYTLVEYGTLVTLGERLGTIPFVKGQEGVAFGRAYWTASGVVNDRVFETVNGRCRFTSVLVDRTVPQYKTAYAFRGYIILEKGASQITLYGPVLSRSIYEVAQQILAAGAYADGSPVHTFVTNLIAQADAYEGGGA